MASSEPPDSNRKASLRLPEHWKSLTKPKESSTFILFKRRDIPTSTWLLRSHSILHLSGHTRQLLVHIPQHTRHSQQCNILSTNLIHLSTSHSCSPRPSPASRTPNTQHCSSRRVNRVHMYDRPDASSVLPGSAGQRCSDSRCYSIIFLSNERALFVEADFATLAPAVSGRQFWPGATSNSGFP